MRDVQVLGIYSSLSLGSFYLLVLDTSAGDRKGLKKKEKKNFLILLTVMFMWEWE